MSQLIQLQCRHYPIDSMVIDKTRGIGKIVECLGRMRTVEFRRYDVNGNFFLDNVKLPLGELEIL